MASKREGPAKVWAGLSADPGRILSQTPSVKPAKVFEVCPSCKKQQKPARLILCGHCWTQLTAAQRADLLAKQVPPAP